VTTDLGMDLDTYKNKMKEYTCALIGLGAISSKHIRVLNSLNCKIKGVVIRSNRKINLEEFGIEKKYSSIEEISKDDVDFIMILVSAENNLEVLKKYIPLKKPIFIEKPVAFNSKDLDEILSNYHNASKPLMIGMNRRFYSVFHKGLEYLNNNNKKLESILIEAPERFLDINKSKFSQKIKDNWMFANSIHCIDLLRFFSGDIKEIMVNSNSKKNQYHAIGKSVNGINFTYISNWRSPGTWKITLYSDEIRIEFNPLEIGKIIEKGSEKEIIPDTIDIEYKSGFYNQMKYFLNCVELKKEPEWPASNLTDHKKTLELIEKIYLENKK